MALSFSEIQEIRKTRPLTDEEIVEICTTKCIGILHDDGKILCTCPRCEYDLVDGADLD